MTYQLNLFEGVRLCLNVDTANSADATCPPQTVTAYGVTSAYNDTPSQDHATPVMESTTYQTTDTEPWSQLSQVDLSNNRTRLPFEDTYGYYLMTHPWDGA